MTTVPGRAEGHHEVGQAAEWRGKVGSQWQENSTTEKRQSVLAIHVDGLNSPIKGKQRVYQETSSINMLHSRSTLTQKEMQRLKVKEKKSMLSVTES
ncbi:MAG: hypothetical protein HUJ62_05385 [Streptococcus gallolyticus]|nr:hypothetical protein [Streptococcus gallolyticus]